MKTPIPQAMSTPTNHSSHHANGGPAFPGPATTTNPQGMTLRDYFAGQALNGFTVSSIADNEEPLLVFMELLAEKSYLAADAMLAARKTKP